MWFCMFGLEIWGKYNYLSIFTQLIIIASWVKNKQKLRFQQYHYFFSCDEIWIQYLAPKWGHSTVKLNFINLLTIIIALRTVLLVYCIQYICDGDGEIKIDINETLNDTWNKQRERDREKTKGNDNNFPRLAQKPQLFSVKISKDCVFKAIMRFALDKHHSYTYLLESIMYSTVQYTQQC